MAGREYTGKKDLHLFAVVSPRIDPRELHCFSSFVERGSGRERPEMDGFDWFAFDRVTDFCTPKLAAVLAAIDLDAVVRRLVPVRHEALAAESSRAQRDSASLTPKPIRNTPASSPSSDRTWVGAHALGQAMGQQRHGQAVAEGDLADGRRHRREGGTPAVAHRVDEEREEGHVEHDRLRIEQRDEEGLPEIVVRLHLLSAPA